MLSNEGLCGSLDTSQVVLNVKAQMQNSNPKNRTKNCTVYTWRAAATYGCSWDETEFVYNSRKPVWFFPVHIGARQAPASHYT